MESPSVWPVRPVRPNTPYPMHILLTDPVDLRFDSACDCLKCCKLTLYITVIEATVPVGPRYTFYTIFSALA